MAILVRSEFDRLEEYWKNSGRCKNFKPKNKNLKYLITDTNGKILKNSSELKSLLKNTNWKKL